MREFLSRCRIFFLYAGVFSFFINILMLTLPLYMLQVFDRVITSRSDATLLMLTIVAAGALLTMMALEMMRSRLLAAAGVTVDRALGPAVLTGLLATAVKPGGNEYVHGLRDVNVLRTFLTGNGIFALFDSPWVPVYLLVIFLFHPLLGVVATAGALVLFGLAWANEKMTRAPLEEMNAEARKAARFIDASLRNAEVVNALGMLPGVARRWESQNNRVIERMIRANHRAGTIGGFTKFARLFIQIVTLAAGAYLVIDQHLTPGVMMAATLILGRALAPVEMAIGTWKQMVEARGAYGRLDKLLASAPPPVERTSLPAPEGRLAVERVVYAIPGSNRAVLKGVSFEVAAGESVGIIGPSAAGKSSLARLIIGIWKPVSGSVRLDGADVAVWQREELGNHIGYLPQDVELFAGTVAENIARLKEVEAEEVIRAAERAHAHDMILKLPNGYDTEIGEGGVVLSGGQRQRIALARAVFGNPQLVVLDEPNANLDGDGEEALMRAMRGLREDSVTLLIISHKPSVLTGVDKLLVLREGALEMYGPRAEVLARVTRPAGGPDIAPVQPVRSAGS